jgi:hypothetical protein
MARQRSGEDLINDALVKADLEAFTSRYPRPEVLRHVNQGGAELWDILLDARGKAFGRSATPWEITTTADTIEYTDDFPDDFLELLSVRLKCPFGQMLRPLASPEEAFLRITSGGQAFPDYYELIPGGIQLFPEHQAGCCVVVEYAVCFTDVEDSASSYVDGVDGWEDYLVCHAARELALKEGEIEFAREMSAEKAGIALRIKKRAPSRDAFRARRVKDVRGERLAMGRGWRW